MKDSSPVAAPVRIEARHFAQLFAALSTQGYRLIGPTLREGAIIYDELHSVEELPRGWRDIHGPGTYRVQPQSEATLFGYNLGPHAWKKFLHEPRVRLWKAQRENHRLRVLPEKLEAPRLALLGVRACELHAIALQDRIFLQGPYVDAFYQARRKNIFIVAVNCGQASANCFCASLGCGPRATSGFDLALTEILHEDQHYFYVEIGSASGAEVLQHVTQQLATATDQAEAERVISATAAHMGRSMSTHDLPALLYENVEHPQWEEIAQRCLSCANCTMVCPTCFCTTVEEVTDLTGTQAERWRRWDSCFTTDFSYIHGGSVRPSVKARYRQWLMHKLATWQDQFGSLGCVGCGRCITWCPVGIDLTAQVRALRDNALANAKES